MSKKKVFIIDKDSMYFGHWGFIEKYDGEFYHVSGGSISSSYGELTPIFNRDQIRITRKPTDDIC
ncbi:hypothetical protein J15TS10_49220 [Paenibacillus woosongensis]|uniref:Uncharacterized protein n=1 Tax=Paenibacillus woosongensis TaxID=307580 RepID=A0ABQ4MYV1_9BACL|nr:hypothetical protein J15TS10_49220 [Paenibacillus woosongensis]